MNKLDSYVETTSVNLAAKGKKTTNRRELLKYLFIRVLICLDSDNGDIDHYWATRDLYHGLKPASDFGKRYGMPLHCFKDLSLCLQFGDFEDAGPWHSEDALCGHYLLAAAKVT